MCVCSTCVYVCNAYICTCKCMKLCVRVCVCVCVCVCEYWLLVDVLRVHGFVCIKSYV